VRGAITIGFLINYQMLVQNVNLVVGILNQRKRMVNERIKLDEESLTKIENLYKNEKISLMKLSKKFNISKPTMRRILLKRKVKLRDPKFKNKIDEKGRFVQTKFLKQEKIICGCGCGKLRDKYDKKGREKKYILGHSGSLKHKLKILNRKCNLCKKEIIGETESKKYCDKCKKEINKNRVSKKLKEDVTYKLKNHLRNRLIFILKKYTKTGKIMSSGKYGINHKAIIEHLKPFPEDISKYHIDHIRPLCSFTLINKDGSTDLEEVKKAFAPENHQWLTAKENLRKGGKYNK